MTADERQKILDCMAAVRADLDRPGGAARARKRLIESGIYTRDGELSPEYGGPPRFGSREYLLTRRAEAVSAGRQGDPDPHEPLAWKRHHQSETSWTWFGRYSAKSIAKWTALRGYVYDVLLANGQRVTVKPKAVGATP